MKNKSSIPVVIAGFITLFIIGIVFYLDSDDDKYTGLYKYDNFYIQLNNNGKFKCQNFTSFEGNYTILNGVITFNIMKFAGKDFNSSVQGRLTEEALIGPDKLQYKKEKG